MCVPLDICLRQYSHALTRTRDDFFLFVEILSKALIMYESYVYGVVWFVCL